MFVFTIGVCVHFKIGTRYDVVIRDIFDNYRKLSRNYRKLSRIYRKLSKDYYRGITGNYQRTIIEELLGISKKYRGIIGNCQELLVIIEELSGIYWKLVEIIEEMLGIIGNYRRIIGNYRECVG